MEKIEYQKELVFDIKVMVDYWESFQDKTSKEKLECLAFSILGILDGEGGTRGGYAVRPLLWNDPGEEYTEGEDLSGHLHEFFYPLCRKTPPL